MRVCQVRSFILIAAGPITRTVSRLCLSFILRTRVGSLARAIAAVLVKRLMQLMRYSWDEQMRRAVTTGQASVLATRKTERWRCGRVESLLFVRLKRENQLINHRMIYKGQDFQ